MIPFTFFITEQLEICWIDSKTKSCRQFAAIDGDGNVESDSE